MNRGVTCFIFLIEFFFSVNCINGKGLLQILKVYRKSSERIITVTLEMTVLKRKAIYSILDSSLLYSTFHNTDSKQLYRYVLFLMLQVLKEGSYQPLVSLTSCVQLSRHNKYVRQQLLMLIMIAI